MGAARDQLRQEAEWARLREYESGDDEIIPGDRPLTRCTTCTKWCVGPLCRDCNRANV